MKRLVLLLGVMISCFSPMHAQTIHWLTFIDTTDQNVGLLDIKGRDVLYNRFINVINAALAEKGYNTDIQDFYGNRMNPENCKRAVEGLTCREDDIVVFYYIGHGTHARNENNPYPQMLLGCDWNEQHKFIPLAWVHDTLKKKNARLVVTIGMCCNNIQGATAKEGPTFGVNYGNTYLSSRQLKAIQNMFLGNKGNFLLSSASVNQSSVGCTTPLGDMDLFTAVMVEQFEKGASEGNLAWNSLFGNVRRIVHGRTNGTQTPFFESNVTSMRVAKKQSQRAKPQQQTNALDLNDANMVGNVLTSCTDYLIDQEQPLEKRIQVAEKLKSLFTSSARVKIMGQDGDIVVDKETIDAFLERLSSSRILLKVVPTAYNYNKEGISELKVKEYYKR